MDKQDKLLTFADEEVKTVEQIERLRYWRVMIVDDDQDVHESTEFALRNLVILNRPLEFLHAYSAAETIKLLSQNPDVAVILLDVVMETEDAGLRIVKTIRQTLGLTDVRIILRTGQPGYAPEMETISLYEINDYKSKNELTRINLYTSLTAAIRSYEQLQRLNAGRQGLQKILDASNTFITAEGIRDFAIGVIMQIAGFIGIKPEGLVCARSYGRQGEQPCYEIIGAAGRYEFLINKPLKYLVETRIQNLIECSLSERRTIMEDQCLVLFCPGRSGNDFAAFVDSATPVHEIDRNLVDLFCSNIGLCGDNISLISRLRDLATVDPLVRLPNRLAFIDAIDTVLKNEGNGNHIVALLDIDCFAEINDVLGSSYGDKLLQAIARCFRERLPSSVVIARVAGGGFGLLGEGDTLYPQLLHALFDETLEIDGIEFLVSFSIGVVRLRDFQSTGTELFQCASIARKRAKSSGLIGQTAYYTIGIRDEIRDSAHLLRELHLALQNDRTQFYLVFQPQIDLESGKVVGLEALVRWKKPDGTVVTPDQFIPIAEQSGLIVSLGEWVLKTALLALQRLHGSGFNNIIMAVNVSVVQFRHPDFMINLDKIIRDSDVITDRLELEITESAAIIGIEVMETIFRELKSRQIAIAIDDFGTGYSSLSYLDRLPADRLKIDRSFIKLIGTDQPGVRITEMVVPLGRQLGMKVLAEGVEDADQIRRLRELGCDEIQGFYTGRPMELEALLDWLANHSGNAFFEP